MIDTEKVSFEPNFKGVAYSGTPIPKANPANSVTLKGSQRPREAINGSARPEHPAKCKTKSK